MADDKNNKNSENEESKPSFSQPSFGLDSDSVSSEAQESEATETEASEPIEEEVSEAAPEEASEPAQTKEEESTEDVVESQEVSEVQEDSEVEEDAGVVEAADAGPATPPVEELAEESEEEEEEPEVETVDEPEPAEEPEPVAIAPVVVSSSGDTAQGIDGLAAYFDYPSEFLEAAAKVRDDDFEKWDAFSPFPVHGIEEAMGVGRSWLPWVTFAAGSTGFLTANALQFGTLTFDWPMIIGGKPYAPWPSFVPIMFELTVLLGGVTTALVMLIASGCFRKPKIIDPEITKDKFVIWIDAKDPSFDKAKGFLQGLDPVEIRDVTFES